MIGQVEQNFSSELRVKLRKMSSDLLLILAGFAFKCILTSLFNDIWRTPLALIVHVS